MSCLYSWPEVLFLKSSAQVPLLCSVSETVTESPGLTASLIRCEGWGSVSTQASYWVRPVPVAVSCVPAWIRSRLLDPADADPGRRAAPAALLVETWGTVQVPVTLVKVPPVAL